MQRNTNSNKLRQQLIDYACQQEPHMPTVDGDVQTTFDTMLNQLLVVYRGFSSIGGDIRYTIYYNRNSTNPNTWEIDGTRSTLYSGSNDPTMETLMSYMTDDNILSTSVQPPEAQAPFRLLRDYITNHLYALAKSVIASDRYSNIFRTSSNPSTDVNNFRMRGVFRFTLPSVSSGQNFHRNFNATDNFIPVIQVLHYYQDPRNPNTTVVPNNQRDTLLFVPKYHKRFITKPPPPEQREVIVNTPSEQAQVVVKTTANLNMTSPNRGKFVVSHQRSAIQPETNVKLRNYIPRQGFRAEFYPHTGYHAVVTRGFVQTRVLTAFNVSIPVNSQMGSIVTECPLTSRYALGQLFDPSRRGTKTPSREAILKKKTDPPVNAIARRAAKGPLIINPGQTSV